MIAGDKVWNEQNIAKLVELRNKGLTGAQIAMRIVGATRNSVIGKLHRLGLGLMSQTRVSDDFHHRVFKYQRRKKQTLSGRTKAYRFEVLAPLPREEQVPATAVTFADLEEHHCRFPYGEGLQMKFCGAKKTHQSYCDYHHRKCCRKIEV